MGSGATSPPPNVGACAPSSIPGRCCPPGRHPGTHLPGAAAGRQLRQGGLGALRHLWRHAARRRRVCGPARQHSGVLPDGAVCGNQHRGAAPAAHAQADGSPGGAACWPLPAGTWVHAVWGPRMHIGSHGPQPPSARRHVRSNQQPHHVCLPAATHEPSTCQTHLYCHPACTTEPPSPAHRHPHRALRLAHNVC